MMLLPAAAEASSHAVVTFFWVAAAAVVAPLLAAALGGRVAQVVALLGLGVLIGPHVTGVAHPGDVALVSELGLGLLFLLAGFEIDVESLKGPSGRRAWGTWAVCFGLAVLVALWPTRDAGPMAAIALGLALCSTALGALLPILQERGQTRTAVGRSVMTHGAVGELGPVLAIAVLLSSRSLGASLVVLGLFAVAVLVVVAVPRWLWQRLPGLRRAVQEGARGTRQLVLRVIVLLLAALMATAAVFGLDVVLGAFAAGVILRRMVDAQANGDPAGGKVDADDLAHQLEGTLNTIAWSIFIPTFFVVSGMGIDVGAVAASPLLLVLLVVAIAVVRGVPVWWAERWAARRASAQEPVAGDPADPRVVALYVATGLPIIVAVTEVAVDNGLMEPDLASVLVAAGAVTVLVFPALAGRWGRDVTAGTR
ncbi:cation:proton antiporter [Kytococcus sedentarius]|uniref:cation:proton antiporter n=1 Tax=Kytococcus sedentarius TaxID=1276 RepID=UPI00387A5E56